MSALGIILVVVILVMLVGSLPHWPYSSHVGYMPSGLLGVLLLIVLLLVIFGRL